MAAAMAMGDCDGNGELMATARATAMVMESELEMVTAIAKERGTMKEGLPLHVAAMCSAFGWVTPCLHPHGHKESSFTSAASWG